MLDLTNERMQMVRAQIAARGVCNPAVLEAMRGVPREAFLPAELSEFAYQDTPLPIAGGQTISQPYIVALMIESVEPKAGDRALEIGTGSGYAAAVLSRVVSEVYTVERHEQLAKLASERLSDLGYKNVKVLHADGTLGWAEHAPYDVILVTAGGPQVPKPLLEQLAIGGRLIIPVGETARLQRLVRVTRTGREQFDDEDLGEVRFVPLIGAEGWDPGVAKPARPSMGRSRPATICQVDPGGRNANRRHRQCRHRCSHRANRRRACRPAWRGDPWNFGVLSDACAHYEGTDSTTRFQLRCGRSGLARCGANQPVRAPCSGTAGTMEGVRSISNLDVAKP